MSWYLEFMSTLLVVLAFSSSTFLWFSLSFCGWEEDSYKIKIKFSSAKCWVKKGVWNILTLLMHWLTLNHSYDTPCENEGSAVVNTSNSMKRLVSASWWLFTVLVLPFQKSITGQEKVQSYGKACVWGMMNSWGNFILETSTVHEKWIGKVIQCYL